MAPSDYWDVIARDGYFLEHRAYLALTQEHPTMADKDEVKQAAKEKVTVWALKDHTGNGEAHEAGESYEVAAEAVANLVAQGMVSTEEPEEVEESTEEVPAEPVEPATQPAAPKAPPKRK
jgi:hypothetical protein